MAPSLNAPAAPGDAARVTVRDVVRTWWPLAASWLLMGFELPAVSAVMARLPEPEVSLAAYGGVIFPLSLLIEAPIIMMLAASTALSRDWQSYVLLRRFALITGGGLSALHALVAFTPLYDVVVGRVLGVPEDVLEPARVGLQIMTPWTVSIAYRRFVQGVLIRFGHPRAVGVGTAVRLGANLAVLALGYWIGTLPGIVVGTAAVAVGVVAEAVYAGWRVHPVLRDRVRPAQAPAEPLTFGDFMRFYTPLMLTAIFMFLAMPMTSGAMTRMPLAIESLAVWPVINGLIFTLRSVGFAYNEVVVAMLEWPGALPALRRFGFGLAGAMTLLLLAASATPAGQWWFGGVSALSPALTALAVTGLWIAFLMPGLSALQSLYQGVIVHSRRTRGVTESMLVLLAAAALVLVAGMAQTRWPGLYFGLLAMVAGNAAQVGWLRLRAGRALAEIRRLDEAHRAV